MQKSLLAEEETDPPAPATLPFGLNMIDTVTIKSFKSLESVSVDLGVVNVFIGANGSGKSNFLEGIGVLSAAAAGKVDDEALLRRGVRPGVPRLYKSAFPRKDSHPRHIFFGADSDEASYDVSLHNPLSDPKPAWRFKTERWQNGSKNLVGRSPATGEKSNPELGLAALKAVECDEEDPALRFLKELQEYAIFAPTTPVLRGIAPDPQPRTPLGLSGGTLATSLLDLVLYRRQDPYVLRVFEEATRLIDWASEFGSGNATSIPLSPSAAASQYVVVFRDRYMLKGRNEISGYDASEGALYVLFLAVLAAHPASPTLCAVDNADHGLNPRLACSLMEKLCGWYLDAPKPRQILLTTHNPLVLDGLPLQDDRVRLFTVSRTDSGRTWIKRIKVDKAMLAKAKKGWTLSRLWVMGHLGGLPDV